MKFICRTKEVKEEGPCTDPRSLLFKNLHSAQDCTAALPLQLPYLTIGAERDRAHSEHEGARRGAADILPSDEHVVLPEEIPQHHVVAFANLELAVRLESFGASGYFHRDVFFWTPRI